MTNLVETIAKALVDHPDHVKVTESADERESVLQLTVAGSDMGKVIGKQGRIARAIRTVVKAAATKEKKNVVVEIVSEEELEEAENILNTEGILDLETRADHRAAREAARAEEEAELAARREAQKAEETKYAEEESDEEDSETDVEE